MGKSYRERIDGMVAELDAMCAVPGAPNPDAVEFLSALRDMLGALGVLEERSAGSEIGTLQGAVTELVDTVALQRRMGETAREELAAMARKLNVAGVDAKWELLYTVGDGDEQSTERLRVKGGWLYRVREWSLDRDSDELALAVTFVPDAPPRYV